MNAHVELLDNSVLGSSDNALSLALIEDALPQRELDDQLMEVLTVMRRHHRLRNFTHQERFGESHPGAERALAQLDQVEQLLRDLAANAQKADQDFVVEAHLKVTLKAQNATA